MKAHQYVSRISPMSAIALAAILFAAGCGPKAPPPASSVTSPPMRFASAPPSKPFVIAYNQWIGYVGLFVALDKGYFKDAGVDVQPKQFPGPADGVPPLIANRIDGALTTADTVILLNPKAGKNTATNVYIIDTSDGADGVVAQKEITSVKDLRGKTVAATKGQCNELLLLKALSAAGMSEKDIRITNMDADTAGAAIIAKKVPAAVTWEPWLTKSQLTGAHVIFTSHDAPNTLLNVIAFSKNTLATRPNEVRAFVAAYARAVDYIKANPDDAAAIAAKHLGSSLTDSKVMLTKVKLYNKTDNSALMGSDDKPGSVFNTATEIGKFYVEQKQLPTVPDTSRTFTAAFLPRLHPM